ncbi:MAG: glycoside hydrolase family 5 protein [Lachnospiraceae bacterium]|nr:glycoside hydrolase family 5 protein [Lachnospiraceae bacterium]
MKLIVKRRRILSLILAAVLSAAALAGCGGASGSAVNDGRARPSSCGRLQVKDGKLCDEKGETVMLRGVSVNGLITSESFLNEELFKELAEQDGVNLFRLAMYTYGMGTIGYCTKGDKEQHKKDIAKGVELAKAHDMYVLIDWHILSDGDPNTYVEEAKLFFAEMAETYKDHDNVLYEICNEPNGVDWAAVKGYAEQVIPVIREKDPDSVIIVGNPDWSKDLRSVAADPLDFENVMYTLHFYSASHGEEFRAMTEEVSQSGLPVFVTEYGITAASGGTPRDIESADKWIELLEKEKISYCMWALSKQPEACSMIKYSVLTYSGFKTEDYTETGLWLLETLKKHSTK